MTTYAVCRVNFDTGPEILSGILDGQMLRNMRKPTLTAPAGEVLRTFPTKQAWQAAKNSTRDFEELKKSCKT